MKTHIPTFEQYLNEELFNMNLSELESHSKEVYSKFPDKINGYEVTKTFEKKRRNNAPTNIFRIELGDGYSLSIHHFFEKYKPQRGKITDNYEINVNEPNKTFRTIDNKKSSLLNTHFLPEFDDIVKAVEVIVSEYDKKGIAHVLSTHT